MTPFRLAAVVVAFAIVAVAMLSCQARAEGPLGNTIPPGWWESLRSPQGVPCCALYDGEFVEWEYSADSPSGYRVFLQGEWHDVPALAVIQEPNLHGRAVVWPAYTRNAKGEVVSVIVRCFLPGAGF